MVGVDLNLSVSTSIWYQEETWSKVFMTSSIWLGKTLTPRMISMSSVRPWMRSMRRCVQPQAHSPGRMRVMSRVR